MQARVSTTEAGMLVAPNSPETTVSEIEVQVAAHEALEVAGGVIDSHA